MPEESVQQIRSRAQASLAALPAYLRELTPDRTYPVDMSDALLALREQTIAHYEVPSAGTPISLGTRYSSKPEP